MGEAVAWASFCPRTSISSFPKRAQHSLKRPRQLTRRFPGTKNRLVVRACASPGDENGTDENSRLSKAEHFRKMMREITEAETALSNPLGLKMSHEIIRFDGDGIGPRDRYVYVEELDCIGCTHCQTTANGTFFMEEEHGRARVFDQIGDIESVVEEAIDTCPVNCIYYVDWEDLVKLEVMRKDQVINNWARLVGGQDFLSSRKESRTTRVMDSGLMRCEDCPGRGCPKCPLYGVGQNPEFMRKKAAREARKAKRQDEGKKRRKRL